MLPPCRRLNSNRGFTLAELLISLAILGVIATFTIPKILTAQQNGQKSAQAKEAASMIAAAYDQYRQSLSGPVPSNLNLDVLLPYMNYVSRQTTGTIDDHRGGGVSYDCSGGGATCLKLASGGILFWYSSVNFGGTSTTNGHNFIFYDPDGVEGDKFNADGPSKSVCFVLYYNGRLTSRAFTLPGTVSSVGTWGPGNLDPS